MQGLKPGLLVQAINTACNPENLHSKASRARLNSEAIFSPSLCGFAPNHAVPEVPKLWVPSSVLRVPSIMQAPPSLDACVFDRAVDSYQVSDIEQQDRPPEEQLFGSAGTFRPLVSSCVCHRKAVNLPYLAKPERASCASTFHLYRSSPRHACI